MYCHLTAIIAKWSNGVSAWFLSRFFTTKAVRLEDLSGLSGRDVVVETWWQWSLQNGSVTSTQESASACSCQISRVRSTVWIPAFLHWNVQRWVLVRRCANSLALGWLHGKRTSLRKDSSQSKLTLKTKFIRERCWGPPLWNLFLWRFGACSRQ